MFGCRFIPIHKKNNVGYDTNGCGVDCYVLTSKRHSISIESNEMETSLRSTYVLVCEYVRKYVLYHSNIFLEIVKRIKYTKSNQNIFIQRPTIRSVVCKYDTRINPTVCDLNSFHYLIKYKV